MPRLTIASLTEVRMRFGAFVESCRISPVVVTKNGRAAAVLVPVNNDDDLDSILLAFSPRFQRLLERANKDIDRGKGISHEELWRRLNQ